MDLFPHQGQIEPYVFRHPDYPESAFWQISMTITHTGLTDEQLADLRTGGWQLLSDASVEERLCALSQLSCALLSRQNTGQTETWIRTEDLRHARRYPVFLVFRTPLLLSEQDSPGYLQQMNIGEDALIFQNNKAYLYHLHQLSPDAARLSQIIRAGIDVFPFSQPTGEETLSPPGGLLPYEQERRTKERERIDRQWVQAQQAARRLARLYWQLHQQQRQQNQPPPQSSPNAFERRTVALIPASLALRGALAAYSNAQSKGGSDWQVHEDERRIAYHYQQAKDVAQVEWRPANASATLPLESLWEKIRALNDHDGDVLLCLLAHWVSSRKDAEGYTWISAEHMLSYRGIQPRSYVASDGTRHVQSYRQEDLAEISASVEHIRNTHVTIHQWTTERPKRRGRPRKHVVELESYLVTITDFLQQHTLLATQDLSPDRVAVAWRYRPGTCLESWLDQQLAGLFQIALNYDPVREQWEKRLSRYFMFHLHIQGSPGSVTIELEAMIRELSLPVNATDPEKTRRRFEKAMMRLQTDHQIAHWRYVEDLADLPSRHWLPIWLSYHIQVTASTLPAKA